MGGGAGGGADHERCRADGIISKKRGRPSNRKTPADVRQAAIDIIRARYADFGPTLAAEKLLELHDITVSRETLRAWMVAEGLWVARSKRRRKIYQLLVFIDDATSRLMHLQFVESESTFVYFAARRSYLEADGKPACRASSPTTTPASARRRPIRRTCIGRCRRATSSTTSSPGRWNAPSPSR